MHERIDVPEVNISGGRNVIAIKLGLIERPSSGVFTSAAEPYIIEKDANVSDSIHKYREGSSAGVV